MARCETRRTLRTTYPDDATLIAVLQSFDVGPDAYLGHGGEAWVYALSTDRVLRVLHEGGTARFAEDQRRLLAELTATPAPFELPQILEVGERLGRTYVVERRLAGVPGLRLLDELDPRGREALVQSHLEASARLGDLSLAPRPFFGDLLRAPPIRASTWHEYLQRRAVDSLARAGGRVPRVDVASLVAELDDVAEGRFVHLDAFLDNMLFVGTTVSAVLDVGMTAAVGDPRFDAVAAAVYVSEPSHTRGATAADADVATDWLRQHGLSDLLVPVRRWLAAFWAGAGDEPLLLSWCARVLSDG